MSLRDDPCRIVFAAGLIAALVLLASTGLGWQGSANAQTVLTATNTATNTPILTWTPSSTPTITPTGTITPTASETPTATPTVGVTPLLLLPSETPTPTPSATPVPGAEPFSIKSILPWVSCGGLILILVVLGVFFLRRRTEEQI